VGDTPQVAPELIPFLDQLAQLLADAVQRDQQKQPPCMANAEAP
jgi:hypothetical protein